MNETSDLKLPQITLPDFLWYVVPGFNFLAIVAVLPIALANPILLLQLSTVGGIIIVFTLALAVGFLLDSLKLYQYSFGYQKRRSVTFQTLSAELGLGEEETKSAFEVIRFGLLEGGTLGKAIAFEHSRWVMINHTSKCFFFFCIIWTCVGIVSFQTGNHVYFERVLSLTHPTSLIAANALVVSISAAIAIRLSRVSKGLHELTAKNYLLYARRNKGQILRDIFGDSNSAR